MTSPKNLDADDIITFWLEAGPEAWFKRDDAFDQQLIDRFGDTHAQACSGALDGWTETANGCLAIILLFDQFSRNMFRGDARAFDNDQTARDLAIKMIDKGWDYQVDSRLRSFVYMPFMHSESIVDQTRMLALSHECGGMNTLKYAIIHRDIIRRFGRFPHRNPVLGRRTTVAEQAFLDAGGFSA